MINNIYSKIILISFLCASLFSPSAFSYLDKQECLANFKDELGDSKDYHSLVSLAKKLTPRDLKCLYRKSEDHSAPDLNFFRNQDSESGVVKIFGKNSVPIFNQFEKHVFSMPLDQDADSQAIYGYNYHRGMALTGPGMFKVIQAERSILIDFSADIESDLMTKNISSINQIEIKRAKNNRFNVFYGGKTKDYCHRLIYDKENQRDLAIVCQGERAIIKGVRKPIVWDILIRQW